MGDGVTTGRWVVLEPDGTVLTAREEHQLLGLSARPNEDGIELTSRAGRSLTVPTPIDGELVPTTTSRLESVRAADPETQRWLWDVLERPVRLAWLDDPRRRSMSASHGGLDGQRNGFARHPSSAPGRAGSRTSTIGGSCLRSTVSVLLDWNRDRSTRAFAQPIPITDHPRTPSVKYRSAKGVALR